MPDNLPERVRQNIINAFGSQGVPDLVEMTSTGWMQGNSHGLFPLDKNGKPMVPFHEYPAVLIQQKDDPFLDEDDNPLDDGVEVSVLVCPGQLYLKYNGAGFCSDAKEGIHFRFL